MREAEIKHGRLAMLACVGWPMAELLDKGLASTFNLPPMLTKTGASPSLLNGGLDKINPFYWALVFSVAALAEYDNTQMKEKNGKNHVIGDCGYDVLGLMPTEQAGRFQRQTSEIKVSLDKRCGFTCVAVLILTHRRFVHLIAAR